MLSSNFVSQIVLLSRKLPGEERAFAESYANFSQHALLNQLSRKKLSSALPGGIFFVIDWGGEHKVYGFTKLHKKLCSKFTFSTIIELNILSFESALYQKISKMSPGTKFTYMDKSGAILARTAESSITKKFKGKPKKKVVKYKESEGERRERIRYNLSKLSHPVGLGKRR